MKSASDTPWLGDIAEASTANRCIQKTVLDIVMVVCLKGVV